MEQKIILYTPATGFPDLEIKIAYGLARVGIEAYGTEKVKILDSGGFYQVSIEGDIAKIEDAFNRFCKRLLSSSYIPFNTPGITSRSAESITVGDKDYFYLSPSFCRAPTSISDNKGSEVICRHKYKGLQKISAIIGFSASTSYHHRRDGLDVSIQQQRIPRRPTDPKNICKACGMLALLGTWYATFIFSVAEREVIITPIPKGQTDGAQLQKIFSLQHQIRKDHIYQEIPQDLIPLVFLSRIPSSADILNGFELHITVLNRQQAYHVDGLSLIPIEKYLSFLGTSPYNIASIDTMLKNEAFGALKELNSLLSHRIPNMLSKFARLYTRETSQNDSRLNLLYPETAKYLLKEVAMIKNEIINNKGVRSFAKTLGYFVWNKEHQNYSFADGIRNASTQNEVRKTLEKLEREAKLRYDQEKNTNGYPPHIPHVEDIQELNKIMQDKKENFEQVKTTLYLLAFSFESHKMIKIENMEV